MCDDSPNGITDGAQLEPPEPPEIHQSELPPAEYDSEHTESEQRNGTVRCVREGTNGGDGIDVGDGLMPNYRSSDVEFANDQTSQSANMLSADHTDPWPLPCSPCPDFQWGSSDGKIFCASITSAYDEAIHWKRNIFLLPSGNAGKSFIQEMTRLLNAFADGSTMESVALKASFVMQMLLLQKPSKRSKAKDHISHLKRRLELWKQGNIEALVQEGKCIQKPLVNKPRPSDNDAIARNFGRMMEQGKVKAALRYLSQNTSGGVLKLEDVVPANGGSEKRTTRHPHRQASRWTATSSTVAD